MNGWGSQRAGEFFKGLLPLSVLPMISNFSCIYRKNIENQQPFPSRQTDTVVLFLEFCVWKWNVNWGLRLIISESACQEVITFHGNFSLLMWSPSTKHFSSSGLCCLVKVFGCDDRVIFLSCWHRVKSGWFLAVMIELFSWVVGIELNLTRILARQPWWHVIWEGVGFQLAPPFSLTYATGKLQRWRCRLVFCLVLLQIWTYSNTHIVYDDGPLSCSLYFSWKISPA